MIERHVTFFLKENNQKNFSRFFFEEYIVAMEKMDGFIKADLLRDIDSPQTITMIIRFESHDAAAAWRNSAEHQSLKPKLKALYEKNNLIVFELLKDSCNNG